MALTLVLSLGVCGFASGEASGASGDIVVVEDTGPKAAIVITDEGEDPSQEQTEGYELTHFAGGKKTDSGLSGFLFTSESSDAALYYTARTEDKGEYYTIGGNGANIALDEYPVSEDAVNWLQNVGVTAFDSAAILGDDQHADSCPPVISSKGYSYLNIDGTLILADGASRSAFYADISDGSTVAGPLSAMARGSESGVVVVRNSLLETTGGGGVTGEISVGNSGGRARGIQPQGKSLVYLYDSAIVSRTWGAWSTDSAKGSLDFLAYRSLGLSQGGYGAYADTSCHLFLYGSSSVGSSDGITASNNGEIYAVASDNTMTDVELRALMGKKGTRNVSWQDHDAADGPVLESVIKGGQCAVQCHMPDMGGSGARNGNKATLYMKGGSLVTDESLLIDNVAAYNMHYAGACIVTKSTQINALLDGTAMESWNGVLIHSVINSDSVANNIADGDEAVGSDYMLQNMDVTGDIVNDDYQRAMRVTLANTTLTGAIHSNTCEDWNALCDAEFDGNYKLNPDGYETVWGVELTLTDGAVWNVTETSVVTDLIINDGCAVNGTITENADGTLTVEPLAETGSASGEATAELAASVHVPGVNVMDMFTIDVDLTFADQGNGVKTFVIEFEGHVIPGTINMGVWTVNTGDFNEQSICDCVKATYEAMTGAGGA